MGSKFKLCDYVKVTDGKHGFIYSIEDHSSNNVYGIIVDRSLHYYDEEDLSEYEFKVNDKVTIDRNYIISYELGGKTGIIREIFESGYNNQITEYLVEIQENNKKFIFRKSDLLFYRDSYDLIYFRDRYLKLLSVKDLEEMLEKKKKEK